MISVAFFRFYRDMTTVAAGEVWLGFVGTSSDFIPPTTASQAPLPVRSGAHASRSLPLSAAIDLHEIHLARQSSLQVPVGHIPVPGGIKLCSPGTFLVANYLIINNGSCQVNFTKPNRATIRYTNS